MTREQMRKIEGGIALTLSTLSALVGLFWLFFILGDVLVHGIKALNLSLFINDPTPPGVEGGGLRNAFVGQLIITLSATLMGVPVGVLGGTFLAEYARGRGISAQIFPLVKRNRRSPAVIMTEKYMAAMLPASLESILL